MTQRQNEIEGLAPVGGVALLSCLGNSHLAIHWIPVEDVPLAFL
jgi:hypothetical protein